MMLVAYNSCRLCMFHPALIPIVCLHYCFDFVASIVWTDQGTCFPPRYYATVEMGGI